jgi:hypothetical protein
MTAFSSSIAWRVLQQCKSRREIRGKLSMAGTFVPTFGGKGIKPVDLISMNPVFNSPEGVDRFQSACKMPYD